MKIKLVCFDMDGVILDSMPTLRALALSNIVVNYGLPIQEAEAGYERTLGLPFLEQLNSLFPEDLTRNQEVAYIYEVAHEHVCPTLPLSPDAKRVIDEMKEDGRKVALVSSTHRGIIMNHLPQVRELGFDYIGGFREGYPKDVQIGFARAATQTLAENTVLIGDTGQDLLFAEKAQVRFILTTCERFFRVPANIYKMEEECKA